jgi:serine/threonine-protein kinase HipA
MAHAAGLDMTSVEILPGSEPHAHLLIRRFDLEDGRRLHQHTLGGLLHVDYNEVGASSYEEYLRAVLRLGMPPAAVEEGYRRMVFNLVAVNHDDHVKNLSFHLTPDGRWRLAPAYDVTFSRGVGWTSTHQMRVADKLSGIAWKDLLRVARTFGVKRADGILDEVRAGVATWPDAAVEAGVAPDDIDRVRAELGERAREVGV